MRIRYQWVVALVLVLLTLPLVGQARDYWYVTNNGTITITGYTGPGGGVTIPDTITGRPVTSIGNGAFYGKSSLTNVIIGANVTSIGPDAFCACTSLPSVTIPKNVTNIALRAFSRCNKLSKISVDSRNSDYSSVDGVLFNKSQTTLHTYPGGKAGSYTIPNNVTNIGSMAFAYCASLTNVTLGSSVTSIGHLTFDACTNLNAITVDRNNTAYCSVDGVLFNKDKTTLIQYPEGKAGSDYTIPKSVTCIGNWAFYYCSSLTSVTIGHYVTNIGAWAFYQCSRLTSVTIPDSVTSIDAAAFFVCDSLTNVMIGTSVSNIGNAAFSACTNLNAITVDSNNTAYCSADGVLFNKNQTTLIRYPEGKAGSFTIPNSVTSVGNAAFFRCIRLTSITIPDSVTSIGDGAFSDCASLTNVTFGKSVTSIGAGAFSVCTSLTRIYFKGNAPLIKGVATGPTSGFGSRSRATVYYLSGTTGWGPTFGGRPTAVWKP